METKIEESPVIRMLSIIWKDGEKATSHSWMQFNHALRDALFIAVNVGFEFIETDLETIAKRFNWGYWIGDDGVEQLYRAAIQARNASAWKAVERYCGRKPFIIPDAVIDAYGKRSFLGTGAKLARLCVGASFLWHSEKVTVTSFKDDATEPYLIACSYQDVGEHKDCSSCGNTMEWPTQKILHRHNITHELIKEYRKQIRNSSHKKEEEGAVQ